MAAAYLPYPVADRIHEVNGAPEVPFSVRHKRLADGEANLSRDFRLVAETLSNDKMTKLCTHEKHFVDVSYLCCFK